MGKAIKLYKTERNLENAIKRLKNDPEVPDEDKQLIIKLQESYIVRGLSASRALFYVLRLHKLSKWLKIGLKGAEKPDLEKLMGQLERMDYKDWTKHDFKVALKIFYQWLENMDAGEYPDKVRWIKTRVKNERHLPEEYLTPEEVQQLIEAAENPRDKAFAAMLYESGCRIGELGTMQIKHVQFDKHGAVIRVDGKTGPRRVRLISSVKYLSNWLSCRHDTLENPDAPLWTTLSTNKKGTAMKYASFRKVLRELASKTGIKKRINCHAWRHAKASWLANKLTEAQMNHYFGWVQGSDMARVYVHMSGRDVDKELFRINGIIPEDEKKAETTLKCPRCGADCGGSSASFCRACGLPLNIGTVIQLEKRKVFDEKIEGLMRVLEDTEVKEFLAGKMAEIVN